LSEGFSCDKQDCSKYVPQPIRKYSNPVAPVLKIEDSPPPVQKEAQKNN
jgi:hypothetical protein